MSLKKGVSKSYFKQGWKDWKQEFWKYKFLIMISVLIVSIATFLDYYSGVYVTSVDSQRVPDLILDHIGPYDLSLIFVYGYLFLVFSLFLYPILFHIGQLHKVVFQFSLLVMIRAFFLIFTHLQTPLTAIYATFPWIFQGLKFENDMFFSGHTAIPLLGFLLFKEKKIKYLFLLGSIVMAIVVLMMHQHYSIDVFAAFFIAYGSYKIGNFLLKKSEKILRVN